MVRVLQLEMFIDDSDKLSPKVTANFTHKMERDDAIELLEDFVQRLKGKRTYEHEMDA